MKALILCLFFVLSNVAFGNPVVGPPEREQTISAVEISKLFDLEYTEEITSLVDFIDKEEKVNVCVQLYIEKQTKSYARVVQENLYDLIHNFEKIASKVQGKKPDKDTISFDEKISALARVQCETYYKMGVLK